MKFLFFFLFLFICAGASARRLSPRLMVPSMMDENLTPVGESIYVPAYSLDILMIWPEDMNVYSKVLLGNAGTIIRLMQNGKTNAFSLQSALDKRMITIYSFRQPLASNPGLFIEGLPGTKLISLRTKGFVICVQTEQNDPITDTSLFSLARGGYTYNAQLGYQYASNQQKLWHVLNDSAIANPNKLDKIGADYGRNILINSGMLPPYYSISYGDGVTNIHVSKIPYDSNRKSDLTYNANGFHYLMMEGIINDLKQLIAEDHQDSTILKFIFSIEKNCLDSIVIIGRYKGIVPVHLCYRSDQKIMLSGAFIDNTALAKAGIAYSIRLGLYYDFDDEQTVCRIPFPSSFTMPDKLAPISMDACNLKILFTTTDMIIGL